MEIPLRSWFELQIQTVGRDGHSQKHYSFTFSAAFKKTFLLLHVMNLPLFSCSQDSRIAIYYEKHFVLEITKYSTRLPKSIVEQNWMYLMYLWTLRLIFELVFESIRRRLNTWWFNCRKRFAPSDPRSLFTAVYSNYPK